MPTLRSDQVTVVHEWAPPECKPACGSPACPWCIVRRQRAQIDDLTLIIREAHGSIVAIERALERAGMPAREEPKAKAKRTRKGSKR